MPTPPFEHARLEWYHWFQATERRAKAGRDDRKGFAHIMWVNRSPEGWFEKATFDQVAQSFENPDWADVTIHSYRSRWDKAKPDPRSRRLEAKVKSTKQLSLPTIYIHCEVDGVNPPSTAEAMPSKFSGPFKVHLLIRRWALTYA